MLALCGLLVSGNTARAVIIRDGNGNLTASSLQNDGVANDAAFPFFANVGVSSSNNASVVYLANGWAISAAHVTISNTAGSVAGVRFGGTVYAIDETTPIRILTNPDGSQSDLQLFHLASTSPLPNITSSMIPKLSPTGGSRVLMIGNGLSTVGDRQFWHDPGAPNAWTLQNASPPASPTSLDHSGFNLFDGREIRWGENNILGFTNIQVGGTIANPINVQGYVTQFDDALYTGVSPLASEAQATLGDSGGGAFSFAGGQWNLSGIIIANFDPLARQPANTSLFGDQTLIADLSRYRNQIVQIVPEPSSLFLALVAAVAWTAMAVYRRLRRRG